MEPAEKEVERVTELERSEMEFEVSILGSAWTIQVRKSEEDNRLNDCSGFTDWTKKQIVILDGRSESSLRSPEEFMKHVLRHEIVHAFLFESGLGDDWTHVPAGHEETVVDWIAWQLQKIASVCIEAEARLEMGGKACCDRAGTD